MISIYIHDKLKIHREMQHSIGWKTDKMQGIQAFGDLRW